MTSDDRTLYFGYGSNLDPVGMRCRTPDAVKVGPAILPDWRLTFRGVADIEVAPGEKVPGGLWLLTDENVKTLDTYEGAPRFYEQVMVTVRTPTGEADAMTYRMTEGMARDVGLPSPGYVNAIVDGYVDFGLPVKYLKRAVARVCDEHAEDGIDLYRPRGAKRLEAVT